MMARIRLSQLLQVLCALALLVFCAAAAEACPNCKEALAANDPEQSGVVKGYFYSILFMMGMPFAFLSCFSIYMYRQVLRARAERASREQAAQPRELVSHSLASFAPLRELLVSRKDAKQQ
jgi:hypothetical protein